VGTIPLLVLALLITVLTNVLLKATPFMMAVGVGTIILLTLAIAALALCFGALYPQFETENAAQIPTSFGGLVFMMATVSLLAVVIVIESVPVYRYLRAAFEHQPLVVTPVMVGAFVLAALVCVAATVIPLRIALRKMEEFEF
jgi:ABC-2 type transport system permease protein